MNQHCGPGGFSPQAPAELCQQLQPPPRTVPEPDVIGLLLVAAVVAWIAKRGRR